MITIAPPYLYTPLQRSRLYFRPLGNKKSHETIDRSVICTRSNTFAPPIDQSLSRVVIIELVCATPVVSVLIGREVKIGSPPSGVVPCNSPNRYQGLDQIFDLFFRHFVTVRVEWQFRAILDPKVPWPVSSRGGPTELPLDGAIR